MKIRFIILLLAAMAGPQLLRAEGPSRKAFETHLDSTLAGSRYEQSVVNPAFETGHDSFRRQPEKRHASGRIRFRGASSTTIPLVWKEVQTILPSSQFIAAIRSQNNRLLLPSYYQFLYRLTLF